MRTLGEKRSEMKQGPSKKPVPVSDVPPELEPFVDALVDLLVLDLQTPPEPKLERDAKRKAA